MAPVSVPFLSLVPSSGVSQPKLAWLPGPESGHFAVQMPEFLPRETALETDSKWSEIGCIPRDKTR